MTDKPTMIVVGGGAQHHIAKALSEGHGDDVLFLSTDRWGESGKSPLQNVEEYTALFFGAGSSGKTAFLEDAGLLTRHGISLEAQYSFDPAFGYIPGLLELMDDRPRDGAGHYLDRPASLDRRIFHGVAQHYLTQLEREPGVEYVVTEAPLTKRQRRRQKGKKK